MTLLLLMQLLLYLIGLERLNFNEWNNVYAIILDIKSITLPLTENKKKQEAKIYLIQILCFGKYIYSLTCQELDDQS